MKRISIDFDNRCLCIMTEGQQGTEIHPELNKEDFMGFIPKKYQDGSSFTWDFEAESFSKNQPYKAIDGFMTKECFVADYTEPMPKLGKRFNEFIKLLGMEPVNLANEIRKEMPDIAKLLGL